MAIGPTSHVDRGHGGRKLAHKIEQPLSCFSETCIDCEAIVTRAYRELRKKGDDDRSAFLSAVHVLELRHPGHDRRQYFLWVARWLGNCCDRSAEEA